VLCCLCSILSFTFFFFVFRSCDLVFNTVCCTRFTDIVYIFSSFFFISSPYQFCICTYVFTAAFCQQFIKEYDDDDDKLICKSHAHDFSFHAGRMVYRRIRADNNYCC